MRLSCFALAIITAIVFFPILQHGFINYDDPDYVTTNEVVQKGLSWSGIQWAFTSGHASNWHPVTWLSHMMDVSLYGMKPLGHHLTNLLFHCANSVLLLLLLSQITGKPWRSAMVAALFALHPLHVESVAWVAERKDVLSAFFGLLTLMAYARYAQSKVSGAPGQKPSRSPKPGAVLPANLSGRGSEMNQSLRTSAAKAPGWYYGLALGLFALGLMSKPMLVTWPFVMLLLDFWPLQRISLPPQTSMREAWRRIQELVVEKVPFFVLATLSSTITVLVQHDAMAKTELVPFGTRLSNAAMAYMSYLEQTFYPTGLAVFYPFPTNFPTTGLLMAGATLLAITIYGIRQARTQPFVIVGWLWFLGTLVPVIGLVQVGAQARADRYTYLPLIGIFIAISWGVAGLAMPRPTLRRFLPAAVLVILTALGLTSRHQLQFWRDDRVLCTRAAEVTTDNYMAWGGLGIVEAKAGNWTNAMTHLMRAYEYARPHHTERSVSYYVGVALQMQGKPKEALPYLQDCLVSTEMQPELNHRLGLSLMDAGRLEEAEPRIRAALAAKPRNLDYNLGWAAWLAARGDFTNAESIYAHVIVQHADEPTAFKAYGDFLALMNRPGEAEPRYAETVRLKPKNPGYRKSYANVLQRNGKTDLAAEQLEIAFKLAPPSAQELLDLSELYGQLNLSRKVLDCYNRAIMAEPESVLALNNAAWLLATSPEDDIRDGKRAVDLSEKACKINKWQSAVLMGTLAAANAEAGRFSEAIEMANKAQAKARADNQEDTAKRNAELLELYRIGKPYRDK